MKKTKKYILIILSTVILVFIICRVLFFRVSFGIKENICRIETVPSIEPDYSDITIPFNIAPLNFAIKEPGEKFYVEISSEAGEKISLFSGKPAIRIPIKQWRDLLMQNTGKNLYITVYVKKEDGKVYKYKPVENYISGDKIDEYLAYRRIPPLYIMWNKVGIYQRQLSSFEETPIITNDVLNKGCINCHSFCNREPDKMLFHTRLGHGTGMILVNEDKAYRVNTRTEFNGHVAYRSWHPDGKIIAFSCNKVLQFFHAVGENRDVLDKNSDLVLYNAETNTITSCPAISDTVMMETLPEWSHDGKYLYFCSAPQPDDMKFSFVYTGDYKTLKYSLMRIAYDAGSDTWGELETVIPSSATGLSITQPKSSPDGRFLMFNMSSYGNFSIYNIASDLYILDLKTGKYFKPGINSDRSDSYHAWSSNSRWVVFSSKRDDGVHTRPYFCHIDTNGNASKPFVLPQEDPEFYSTDLLLYNVPEFVNDKFTVSRDILAGVSENLKDELQAELDPDVEVRGKDTEETGQMWRPGAK
jgi:hypothetical protein